MKRRNILAGLLSGALLTTILTTGAQAASPSLYVNGSRFRGDLHVSDGRIYVPLRGVCEAMGYRVEWDSAARAAVVHAPSAKLHFRTTGDNYAADGAMYTPVRELADSLDAEVSWNSRTATATISAPDKTNANYTQDELYWLARIVYAEARGESMDGKIAVANTVLARVQSDEFPNTIYGVIFDTKYAVQYEPVSNGTIYNEPDTDSYEAARRALEGEQVVSGCMYFFNPEKATSTWIERNRTYVTTIGNHVFYA